MRPYRLRVEDPMTPFVVALVCALGALILPVAAGADDKPAVSTPPGAPGETSSTAPGAPAPGPILEDTPLLAEARKRPPRELWIEMTQIQDEMHAHAADQEYPPLKDLATRLQANMLGAFVQVFDPLAQPRRIGLKRAVVGCASVAARVDQAVTANWPTDIDEAMTFVDGCMQMLARFYPPEMTGLPDEFASAQPASGAAPAPADKKKSD